VKAEIREPARNSQTLLRPIFPEAVVWFCVRRFDGLHCAIVIGGLGQWQSNHKNKF
jgi:hypothetical protein